MQKAKIFSTHVQEHERMSDIVDKRNFVFQARVQLKNQYHTNLLLNNTIVVSTKYFAALLQSITAVTLLGELKIIQCCSQMNLTHFTQRPQILANKTTRPNLT